jgi:hypothetical protein
MQRKHVQSANTDAANFIFEGFLAGLEKCSRDEIRAIVTRLSGRTQRQLAAFCFGREQLKEIGREIAVVCFEHEDSTFPAEEVKAWSRAEWSYHHDGRSEAA